MFKKFLITIVSISASVAVLIDGYLMFFKHDQSQETAQSQATAASDTESESSTTTSSSSTSSSNSTMKDGTYTGKATRTGLAVVDCSLNGGEAVAGQEVFNQGEGGVDAGGIEGVGVLVNQGGGQASLSRLVLGGPVLIEVL